jgi:hypothetical protein
LQNYEYGTEQRSRQRERGERSTLRQCRVQKRVEVSNDFVQSQKRIEVSNDFMQSSDKTSGIVQQFSYQGEIKQYFGSVSIPDALSGFVDFGSTTPTTMLMSEVKKTVPYNKKCLPYRAADSKNI